MRSNPATVARLAYERIKTSSTGAATRALLGAGAASVIPWTALAAGPVALPARVLVAYKPGPVSRVAEVDQHGGEWWIYDDPAQGTWRIDQVAAAIAAAYDPAQGAPLLPFPAGQARLGALSEPRIDRALGGFITRRLPLVFDA
jgi:hypothetical protein